MTVDFTVDGALFVGSNRFDLSDDLHHDFLIDRQFPLTRHQPEPPGTAAEGKPHGQSGSLLRRCDLALCSDLALRLSTRQTGRDERRQAQPVFDALVRSPTDKGTPGRVTVFCRCEWLKVPWDMMPMVVNSRMSIRFAQKAPVVPQIQSGIPWKIDSDRYGRTGHLNPMKNKGCVHQRF